MWKPSQACDAGAFTVLPAPERIAQRHAMSLAQALRDGAQVSISVSGRSSRLIHKALSLPAARRL